jgi:hypothetical protein
MAITINSLTPAEPIVVTDGDTINFAVSASDDGGATLNYEWQISTDGGSTYSASGLTGNTNSFYNLGPVDSGVNGIFVRVAITNGVDTIYSDQESVGSRSVTVTAAPIILALVEGTVDDYPVSETIDVNETFDFTVTSSLQNVDISTTTNVNNISIVWQESTDNGSTWTNITPGGDYTVTTTTELFSTGSTNAYYRKSILSVANSGYSRNLYQYRSRISYTGASNTPVDTAAILLYVQPVISIFKQPGVDALDTETFQCYKTGIVNSGEVRVSVGAVSTSGQALTYKWELSVEDENGFPEPWAVADDGTSGGTNQGGALTNSYRLKSGTNHTSPVLELDRFIFYNVIAFRCQITGSAAEPPVTTNTYYVYPTDVQTAPVLPTSFENIEDKYGNIVNRDIYPDPEQTAEIIGELNIARNTGQNGDVLMVMQRQNPGETTWNDVLTGTEEPTSDFLETYTAFPTNDVENTELTYETPPLRVADDDGAKYRIKVTSSAVWTGSNTSKTLTEFYSNEATLNVYRTVYISNQPSDASAFPNEGAAFSVTATPSSGVVNDISYQWQYSTDNLTFTNLSNGGIYSGATTSLLQISSVPSTLTYPHFRCVLSVPNQLASVTTQSAELYVKQDLFTSITNLNDQEVEENSVVSWTVVATSLSASTPTYQWQKSTNFDTNNPGGATWTDISGETSATFNILSAALSDAAFYRCKVTSFGGTVQYTNEAQLTVVALTISILTNIATTFEILEGVVGTTTFETEAISSNSGLITYQWEYKQPGGSYQVAGDGFNNSEDDTRFYTPDAFTRSENGIKLRCKITAAGIPNPVYTNECTITVNRRLTYVKAPDTLAVTIGTTLVIDINPTWTGGTPSFQWQEGGSDISGATTSSLIIPNIDSSYNNNVYRCKITLADCNQYAYTENNSVVVQNVSATDYTKNVTISTQTAAQKPKYYSKETEKSGASIGTVICIPKPDGYSHNPASTSDDINDWDCAKSGTNGTSATSTVTSGSIYNSNKPSWSTSYNSPKWILDDDRFQGYIEMRGQYVKAADFPELARMLGTTYGGSISGTYPTYSSSDYFRLPLTYGKKVMGTGNISGNSGSVSIIPEYAPDGASGGDKLLPGSMGGVYNYIKSAQLPPGSTGITGDPDGTADGSINAETYTIGTFQTNGWETVEGFVQPKFQGTVTYTLPGAGDAFVANPVHAHSAIAVGAVDNYYAVNSSCNGNSNCLNTCNFPGSFRPTTGGAGEILPGPYGLSESTAGKLHTHTASGLNGSFDMVTDAGMIISDTTARMNLQSKQLFDNATSFYLRNNEAIPVNAAYFRLRYMIKAY